jgi:ABC-type transport system involved in multi-copper enzyme maturation permease subunit
MPIYDLSYKHYEGPRTLGHQWLTIARQTCSLLVKKRISSVTLVFMGFTLVVFTIGLYTVVAGGYFGGQPIRVGNDGQLQVAIGPVPVPFAEVLFVYVAVLLWPALLYVLAGGPGAISNDRQSGGLILILARPLRCRDYIMGKMLGIAGVPTCLAALVIVVAWLLTWTTCLSFDQAMKALPAVIGSVAYLLVFGVYLGLSTIAFIGAVKNQRTAIPLLSLYWLAPFFLVGVFAAAHLETLGVLSTPIACLDGVYLKLFGLTAGHKRPVQLLLAGADLKLWHYLAALAGHLVVLLGLARRVFVGVR